MKGPSHPLRIGVSPETQKGLLGVESELLLPFNWGMLPTAAPLSSRKAMVLVFASALLFVLAFPPWNLDFLAFVAFVPWLAALDAAKSPRNAAMRGHWLGFFISLGGFAWVGYVLHEFGSVPIPLSVLGLLFFACLNQLQFPLWAWLYFKVRARGDGRLPMLSLLSLAVIYTGIDAWIFKLFVDTLGHSQHSARWMRQVAEFGGAYLLTFILFFFNLALWDALAPWVRGRGWLPGATKKQRKQAPAFEFARPLRLAVGIVAITLAYGSYRYHQLRALETHPTRTLRLSAIQANIGDFDKVAAERGVKDAAAKVLATFKALSEQALTEQPQPDALVWPETAYPSLFRTPYSASDADRDQELESFVATRGVPLLFGGYDRVNGKDHNTFFALSPTHLLASPSDPNLQIYHKSVLLPLGEFIPGADRFPIIKELFPMVGNFGRGPGPTVLDVRTRKGSLLLHPIICYEILFPDFVAEAARKGAELIVNVTNDSWFGPFGEPDLHFALSKFRDLETRLPQLRSTNTGISGLILPSGEVENLTATNTALVMTADVPLPETGRGPVTLVTRFGDWFAKLCTWLAAGLLVWLFAAPSALRLLSRRYG